MGRANVYLPDDLERRVKAANVPISEVCQHALLLAVDAAESDRQPLAAALGDLYARGREIGSKWAGSAPHVVLLALLRDQRLPEVPANQLPEFWYSLSEEQTTAWEAGFVEAARDKARAAVGDLRAARPSRGDADDDPRDASAAAGSAVPHDGPALGDPSTCHLGVDRDGNRVAFDPHTALAADKSPLFAVLGPADQRARLTLGIGQDAACRGAAVVMVDVSGQLHARAAGLGKNVRVIQPAQQQLPSLDELMRGGANLRSLWASLANLSGTGGALFPHIGAHADDVVKPGYVTVISLSGDGALASASSASTAARALAGLSMTTDQPRLLFVDLPSGITVPGSIAALLTRLVRTARDKQVAFGLSAESADAVRGVGGSGPLLSTVLAFATSSPVEADRLRDLLGAHAPVLLTPPGSVLQPGEPAWCVMRDLYGRLGQVRIDTI